MSRLHREILKQQLMNHDYSNTPVSKTILLDLYEMKLTRTYEGPDGFTHAGYSDFCLGSLVDDMNRQVSRFPDYDLIIIDTK